MLAHFLTHSFFQCSPALATAGITAITFDAIKSLPILVEDKLPQTIQSPVKMVLDMPEGLAKLFADLVNRVTVVEVKHQRLPLIIRQSFEGRPKVRLPTEKIFRILNCGVDRRRKGLSRLATSRPVIKGARTQVSAPVVS